MSILFGSKKNWNLNKEEIYVFKNMMSTYKVDINVKNTNVYLFTPLMANSKSCEKQYH